MTVMVVKSTGGGGRVGLGSEPLEKIFQGGVKTLFANGRTLSY